MMNIHYAQRNVWSSFVLSLLLGVGVTSLALGDEQHAREPKRKVQDQVKARTKFDPLKLSLVSVTFDTLDKARARKREFDRDHTKGGLLEVDALIESRIMKVSYVPGMMNATYKEELLPTNPGEVLHTANDYDDKGGYDKSFKSTGVPKDIKVDKQTLLKKSTKGTYCSGFTFAVAMDIAKKRDLLKGKTAKQLRQLQRDWYGVVLDSDKRPQWDKDKIEEKTAVFALREHHLGYEVGIDSAKPGDIVQFWRSKTGHSAILLEVIEEDGKKIGLKYRSSQSKTDGVGDRTEYFKDVKGKKGYVDRKRTYFGRLAD